MHGSEFGPYGCDPVSRARSYRMDFEREIAQMQLRSQTRVEKPAQPRAERPVLWGRLGRAMRVLPMRNGLAAH